VDAGDAFTVDFLAGGQRLAAGSVDDLLDSSCS